MAPNEVQHTYYFNLNTEEQVITSQGSFDIKQEEMVYLAMSMYNDDSSFSENGHVVLKVSLPSLDDADLDAALDEESSQAIRILIATLIALIVLGGCLWICCFVKSKIRLDEPERNNNQNEPADQINIDFEDLSQPPVQNNDPLTYVPVVLAKKYLIDKVYPPLTYYEIKKILIRMKDRKFLTRQYLFSVTVFRCTICLDEINDKSICRMLSCYHIFHRECIDEWMVTKKVLGWN